MGRDKQYAINTIWYISDGDKCFGEKQAGDDGKGSEEGKLMAVAILNQGAGEGFTDEGQLSGTEGGDG